MKKRSLWYAGVASLTVIGSLGCGSTNSGNGDAGANDAGPTTRSVSGLSKCSVKQEGYYYLGVALPFTGGASNADWDLGALHAAQDINAGGGIKGKSLGLVFCDTSSSPEGAKAAVAELGAASPVSALVGPGTSGEVGAALAEIVAGKKVVISPQAASPAVPKLVDDDFVFRMTVDVTFEGTVAGAIAYAEGLRKAALVLTGSPTAVASSAAFKATFEGLGGTTVTVTMTETATNADISNAVDTITAANADVVYLLTLGSAIGPGLMKGAIGKNYKPRWILTNQLLNDTFAVNVNNNTYLEGAFGITLFADSVAKAFATAYQTRWMKNATYVSSTTYDATMMLAIAMSLAADPEDSPSLRSILHTKTNTGTKVSDWASVLANVSKGEMDYQGASGPADFDATGSVSGLLTKVVFTGGRFTTTGCYTPTAGTCP